MFSIFFIRRPVFATVISIVIVLAGLVALGVLPIARYPTMTPPTVTVRCTYPGANAQTVSDTVGAPIEEQVNGVEGMIYMSSVSANDGTYTLTVSFAPTTCARAARGNAAAAPHHATAPADRRNHVLRDRVGWETEALTGIGWTALLGSPLGETIAVRSGYCDNRLGRRGPGVVSPG